MDQLLALAFFATSVLLALLYAKERKRRSESSPVPAQLVSDPVEPAASAATNIEEIAATLDEAYERSGHPESLLSEAGFERGVAFLRDPALPVEKLVQGIVGANHLVALMAAEALIERDDREAPFSEIVAFVPMANLWRLYYLMRYFGALDQPVVARMLLMAREWWPENPLLPKMLSDFVDARIARGEEVGLYDALRAHGCEFPDELETLLAKLTSEHSEALHEDLERWRRGWVDTKYLSGVGRVWTEQDWQGARGTSSIDGALRAALPALRANRSMIVVGEPGVGKTSFVRRLAAKAQEEGWTLFEASASDLLAGQTFIGQFEGRVREILARVAVQKRVLFYIPAFHESYFVGRHNQSPIGLLDLLQPSIEAGRVCVLGETHPAAWDLLLQQKPRLRNLMHAIRLEPASRSETLVLARDVFDAHEVEEVVHAEALELACSYLTTTQRPGNVLDLLHQACAYVRKDGPSRPVSRDDLLTSISLSTGLPRTVIDERVGLDVEELRSFLTGRVLGQPEAVHCLVDRIAMLKAGLTDPDRPVGVFLFAGPTGTGKTEVAKTLARYLFGSKDRLIRLDMSEYQDPSSLGKMLGDGSDGEEQSLVRQIRRQPFSVVLLDEFEKAHPRVWDLFLQVFDDGRLSDARGNVADFRHCILILTSNLGATAHHEGLGFVRGAPSYGSSQVTRAIETTFRPEFVNRIDRVVVFHPLPKTVMRDILRKELRAVLERRGFRNRDWAVEWEESAIDFLLARGFTPDMGARPLRRAIDEHVLAPLARTIVENRFPEGDQFLFVRGAADHIEVEFVDPESPPTAMASTHREPSSLAAIVTSPDGSAGERACLESAVEACFEQLASDAWAEQKRTLLAEMDREDFWDDAARHEVLSELERRDSIESALGNAVSLMRRFEARPRDLGVPASIATKLALQLYMIRHALDDLEAGRAAELYLAIETAIESASVTANELASEGAVQSAEARRFRERLFEMYRAWAKRRHVRFETLRSMDGDQALAAIAGLGVHGILGSEAGLHVFELPNPRGGFDRVSARVRIVAQPCRPVPPAEEPALAAALLSALPTDTTIVRRYRAEPSPLVRDSASGWRSGRLDRVLDGDFDLIE
ncbi:MAG: AAA family ATPase [Planctomycetes bacterium]|nr:AAA family ATPase [Planctomycetota bacterium]MCB9917175.1 AAA family ATPase [Planctomycetota bacterium]